MKRRVIYSFAVAAALGGARSAQAQAVPQAVVVEHFTNSRCSICFNRNPGFYANLAQQRQPVIHIAYHPSAPYRQCVFSLENTVQNDARTNYYGVYGSTPRLVINGQVVPSAQNYADTLLFAPFRGQQAPAQVRVTLAAAGPDSLVATASVRTVAPPPVGGHALWLALVEDTVFYAAPNGERVHPNVFRRSFSGAMALPLTLAPVGDSVVVRRTVARDSTWTPARLYALAIVQQPAGALVQAAASERLRLTPTGLPTTAEEAGPRIATYPNPVRETLQLRGVRGAAWRILDATGREMAHGIGDSILPTQAWPAGTYGVVVGGRLRARVVRE